MATTVSIDIGKLAAAISAATDLAGTVDYQRNRALQFTPIALESLNDDGQAARAVRWLRANLPDLKSRHDLAVLLDTEGSGNVSFTVPADTRANIEKMLGEQLARQAEKLGADPDPKAIERFSQVMEDNKNNAAVMSSMYQSLGPGGVVGTTYNLYSMLQNGGNEKAIEQVLDHIRDGLATASDAPGFPDETFGKGIVKYSTGDLDIDDPRALDFANKFPDVPGQRGAAIMDYLFRDANLSGGLIYGAAQALDNFERNFSRGAMYDDVQQWYQYTGSASYPGADGEVDVMATLMGQFGRNPDYGLKFFTDAEQGDARQQYYFDDRTWKADGYEGISQAVNGIGTNEDLLESDAKATTTLVSRFMARVSDSDGFDAENAKPASPYIADLMKFYMPAADKALRNPDVASQGASTSLAIDNFGSFDEYPVFYKEDLDALMQVSMASTQGMQSVAEGVGAYRQTGINNIAARLAEDPDNQVLRGELREAFQATSRLEGFAEYSAGQVEINGAKREDAQRNAFIKLATEAAGLVPLPGAEHVGKFGAKSISYAWNQGVGVSSGAAQDAWASSAFAAEATAEKRAELGSTRTKLAAYRAMVEAGLLQPEDDDIWYDHRGRLKDLSDLDPRDYQQYGQTADNGLNDFGTTGADIQSAYKDQFLYYYKRADSK